jgi:hypothetical protein
MSEEKKTRARKPKDSDVIISQVEYDFLIREHMKLESLENYYHMNELEKLKNNKYYKDIPSDIQEHIESTAVLG